MCYVLVFFWVFFFVEMKVDDDLVIEGWCFVKMGEYYVIYFKNGGNINLILVDEKSYQVCWYNLRIGEFKEGDVMFVNGVGQVSFGNLLEDEEEDWVILV